MRTARLFFGVTISIAIAAACTSSTGGAPGGAIDSGADGGDAGNTCTPVQKCAQGLTCCFAIAGDRTGTCTAPTSCTGSVSYQCLNAGDCATGVCCLSGLDPSTIDASSCDGGPPANLVLSLICSASCSAQQSQLCRLSSECTGGNVCVTATQCGFLAGFCTAPPDAGSTSEGGSPSEGGASDGAALTDAASGG